MRWIGLVAAFFFVLSADFAPATDIYIWTDDEGVKHFSNQEPPQGAEIFISAASKNQNSPPLKTPSENEPSADARLDEELLELRKLLEELKRQLEANRQIPAVESNPELPNPEYAEAGSFEPPVEPFRGYRSPRHRFSKGSYYPFTLCYQYGRYYRGYACGKSYYTYYPGVRRHYYHGKHRYSYNKQDYFRKYRYGHHLNKNRYTGSKIRSGHHLKSNRFTHRSNRFGGAARVRSGARIGHRR